MVQVKLWSEGYKCTKTGIFCRTESVAMTLKIMCTYAHYVTLGSCCKMASSHRVTDLKKIPVWISKDEAPTPLSVVGPLFISSLLFHLSQALLGAWHFSLFRSVYSSFHNRLDLIREPACVLFYFPNLSLFVSSYVKIKKFCSILFNRLAISWPPWVRVQFNSIQKLQSSHKGQWVELVTGSCHSLFFLLACPFVSLGLPFCFSRYIVHLRCMSEGGSLSV